MQNLNLRYIYFIIFSDFWRRFFPFGFKVWKKYKFGLQKFHTDFKSAEKVFKSAQKKSYKQNKFDEHE